MVRESLRERGRLMRNAAPLVHPLRFVIPAFRPGRRWYYYAGLKAYDFLAGRQNLEPASLLSARQVTELLPALHATRLRGGVGYSDGQFDDARLAIALAKTACQQGAVVLNYAPVVTLTTTQGKISGLVFRDLETQQESEVRARVVINATGVFAESITAMDPTQAHAEGASKIRPSQGTHLVLPREFLPGDTALMIPDTDDGRVLFAIPWLGATLLGTTDIAVEHITNEPVPLASEVDYLLEHAGRYLTKAPTRQDVLSQFAGLRPLVAKSKRGQTTSQLSREHEIDVSPAGLISVIGGKWTTYRKMGQDVIDLAAGIAGLRACESKTADMKLQDADSFETATLNGCVPTEQRIAIAVKHEMARTLEDVLARRTRCLFLNAAESIRSARSVATTMATLLERDAAWIESQERKFTAMAANYRSSG